MTLLADSTGTTAPSDERFHAAHGDLREFLRLAEETGALRVVRGVDPMLEMGAIHELSLENEAPPVLLFDDIRGYPSGFRVMTNVQEGPVLKRLRGLDAVRAARKGSKGKGTPVEPEWVTDGPVLENVLRGGDVNVNIFPAPKWHADDGGRYVGTQCVVITEDPDTGWINLGTYRAMVSDEKHISVFIEPGKHGAQIRKKYWERGQPCPMALCVGQAPAISHAAGQASKHGESELATAGGQIGRPIRVVRGPALGVPFPADAEIVFEGLVYAPEVEARPEGPFGEWPGYYASHPRPEPVLKVEAIYHRNDPILTGDPPIKPTYRGRTWSGIAKAAAIWDAMEAAGVSGVKGVWKMQGGGPRFITVIALEQQHAGHAKMAGLVATGCGAGAYLGRMTIVVDDDIDITDPGEVMWALATRWDPKKDTDIIEGCWTGHIDPILHQDQRESGDLTSTRIIMYATRPWHWKEDFPKPIKIEPGYADEVRAKWAPVLDFLNAR